MVARQHPDRESRELEMVRVLADDTRVALYRELQAATSARSIHELAERLHLHPNSVRPHLERMRDAGLVEVEAVHRGTPGRPQHRYSISPSAPALGFEPPAHTLLAGMLAALAEQIGASADDAVAIGRAWGAQAVDRRARQDASSIAVLTHELDQLGFEPDVETAIDDDGGEWAHIAFLRCPFRELAEAYPELVCHLHRGICEGALAGSRSGRPASAGSGRIEQFNTLYDRDHCSTIVSPVMNPVIRPAPTSPSGASAR